MNKIISIILISASVLFAGVGDNATEFTLEKLGGDSVSLSDFDGKVIYIFWFGFGCPYCKGYMPLSQLNVTDNYSTDVFQALGIDTWQGSSMSKVASFQSATITTNLPTGVTYPLLINGENVAIDFGVTYDRSMVIDQQGVIRYYDGSHFGGHNWSEINNVIRGLLSAVKISDGPVSLFNFELKANYPNPFNPSTTIPFSIDKPQNVKLQIYNITGKLVYTLIDALVAPGQYELMWDGRNTNGNRVSSGVYFSRLSGDRQSQVKQLILLK